MTPIRLERNISKTAVKIVIDSVPKDNRQEMASGYKWSCDRCHHVTLVGQTCDPSTPRLEPNISKRAGFGDSVPTG